jgi:hypothetical protein
MDLSPEVLAAASLAIGSIVWLIRLEGRVNTHEAICSERYRQLQARHQEALDEMRSMDAKLDSIIHRL